MMIFSRWQSPYISRQPSKPEAEMRSRLARLAEHGDVDYVIVHKIDRLARNRADHVQIQLTIELSGREHSSSA